MNAYLFLLCEAWLQSPVGSLPNDEDVLIELARVTCDEWAQIWPVIRHKFQSDGNGRIYNQELVNEADMLTAQRRAGQSGWTDERRKKQSEIGRKNVFNLKQNR